ncbi:hypothetical protein QVD17_27314 [Tagetes erecta]|uniref:non-specific serine/threonine protein kinase n=1 Tax=Tagetes erecta TaxID=13708 RepID=A0AAD8NQZ4_TARER|nr:hypothetical protein QVD17_27314 [Tagetes erecta]
MLKLNLVVALFLFFILTCSFTSLVQSLCNRGCDLALGSYYVEQGVDIELISQYMNTNTNNILKYNSNIFIYQDNTLPSFVRINVPFSCDCMNNELLGHVFTYQIMSQDTYPMIAQKWYANLTTEDWIRRFNSYYPSSLPDGGNLNVTVNCSCGDTSISKDYGLFITYPLHPGETLDSVSSAVNLSSELIRSYNPDVNFSQGSGLIYIPGRDENGGYPPLKTSSDGRIIKVIVIIGVLAVVVVVMFLAGCLYCRVYRTKNAETNPAIVLQNTHVQLIPARGVIVDKTVEFPYEELWLATHAFSLANKIGQGGFGAVYYAELRGEKAAIKKMNMQASKQFLAELKVLNHVHHLNLVRLIGYCVEHSLFLVFEYVENGNLSQHLHGLGREPLSWSIRLQVALDSARGLEYIHEHTVPIYVHCDIKSENILIDKNFHGKVADFGITRLTRVVGSKSRLVGTFGYMPPEYIQYGDVSPKVDVYAFGVVLYELISAKQAIIRADNSDDEPKGLVALFDEVLSQPDGNDGLVKMIDPRMGDNYPLDSVHKMAQLAKACTHEDPRLRPSMRHVVVALMTLSSST